MRRFLGAGIVVAVAVPALGQSINVDFGPASSAPPHSYAAVGQAGTWNAYPTLLPEYQRFNMVNQFGRPIPARIYNSGATDLLTHHIPGTAGGDAALMDDMLLSHNNPVDACIWVEHLLGGTYQVIIYAMTPDDPTLLSRVRVDSGAPGPVMVGGAWPGMHVEGVTYERFTVDVPPDGTIGLHSGLYGGNIQSGINGFQLVRGVACPADVNGDGAVNVQDFLLYLQLYAAADPGADVNGDGAVNVADYLAYLAGYSLGCS
jgi:hypothetical protein